MRNPPYSTSPDLAVLEFKGLLPATQKGTAAGAAEVVLPDQGCRLVGGDLVATHLGCGLPLLHYDGRYSSIDAGDRATGSAA